MLDNVTALERLTSRVLDFALHSPLFEDGPWQDLDRRQADRAVPPLPGVAGDGHIDVVTNARVFYRVKGGHVGV